MSKMFKTVTKTWNPVVGCHHNCTYCVSPESRVLMANLSWKPISEIKIGDQVVGFEEHSYCHRLRSAEVTAVFHRKATNNIFRLIMEDREVLATGEHPWLHNRGWWTKTHSFAPQRVTTLRAINIEPNSLADTELYRLGYLKGICEGDAAINPIHRDRKHPSWFRLALTDLDALDYAENILQEKGIILPRLAFKNIKKPMEMLQTQSRDKVQAILALLSNNEPDKQKEFRRGWLAGIFDAEGTYSGYICIANHSQAIKTKISDFGRKAGFTFIEEARACRLIGNNLSFLSYIQPKIQRKVSKFEGNARWGHPEAVVVEKRHTNQKGLDIINLETTTSTYIVEGLASHNCWARRLAETKLKDTPRYKDGFIPKLVEKELNTRFKPGEFVFVSDMGDLFGDWVPTEWIEDVLEIIMFSKNSKFLLQTKNPKRFQEFTLPYNTYLGTTIETNRDYSLSKAPAPFERYYWMKKLIIKPPYKFLSIEPIMDFDLDQLLYWIEEINPSIIEVGADNYKNNLPEPSWDKVERLLKGLREICPDVKEKDGLERLR